MSRQKLVFPTNEVFHLWANQTQQEARNSQGNVFFEGTKIWSYGKHYLLAELFPDLNACIFNSDSYSNTTAKHQSKARQAVDYNRYTNRFFIPDCDIFKAGEYYLKEIIGNLSSALTAKSKKADFLTTAQVNVESARRLNELFPGIMLIPVQLQHYFNNPIELTPEQITAHKAQQKLIRDRRKQKQIELQKENEEKIQEWIEGKRYNLPYSIDKVYLRFTDEDGRSVVETSKGATVPYREAKFLFRSLQQVPPKHFEQIGGYKIHGLKGNILVIGCHHIEMDEVNRFAASQGWTTNNIIEPTLN